MYGTGHLHPPFSLIGIRITLSYSLRNTWLALYHITLLISFCLWMLSILGLAYQMRFTLRIACPLPSNLARHGVLLIDTTAIRLVPKESLWHLQHHSETLTKEWSDAANGMHWRSLQWVQGNDFIPDGIGLWTTRDQGLCYRCMIIATENLWEA